MTEHVEFNIVCLTLEKSFSCPGNWWTWDTISENIRNSIKYITSQNLIYETHTHKVGIFVAQHNRDKTNTSHCIVA